MLREDGVVSVFCLFLRSYRQMLVKLKDKFISKFKFVVSVHVIPMLIYAKLTAYVF